MHRNPAAPHWSNPNFKFEPLAQTHNSHVTKSLAGTSDRRLEVNTVHQSLNRTNSTRTEEHVDGQPISSPSRRNAAAHAYTIHRLRPRPRTLRILLRDDLRTCASASHARRALQAGHASCGQPLPDPRTTTPSCRCSREWGSLASCLPRGASDRQKA